MNGEKINLITQRSNQNPTNKYNVIEADPLCNFDAESISNSSFDGEMTSEAGGIKRFIQNRRKIQAQRQARKNLTAKSKAMARVQRTRAKETQAQSQKIMAKKVGSDSGSDAAIAAALATPAEKSTKSKTGLYIGIGAGVLVVAGIITFFVLRKKK